MEYGTEQGMIEPPVVEPGQASIAGNPLEEAVVGSGQEPVYVSKDEIQRMMQEQERKFQGLIDKNVSRVDKRVSEAIAQVDKLVTLSKANGLDIPTEQVDRMKENAVRQALTQQSDPASQIPAEGASAQMPTEAQGQVDPVTSTARTIMQRMGVQLTDQDPEYSLIDQKTEDAWVFLSSVQKAAEAKKGRMAKPLDNPAAAPGAMGAGGIPSKETPWKIGTTPSLDILSTAYKK